MNVLVLNCGSSSVKFRLIATDLDLVAQNADRRLAKGTIERIGGEAIIRLQVEGHDPQRSPASLRDINAAVDFIARWAASPESGIEEIKSIADIQAVGHRVVHGGERFKQSVLITDEVVRAVEDCIDLAPLHNPANLTGISATRKLFGEGLPQVAVFDTAFHQTLPDHAFLYALPYQLYRRYRLRRYGFHGISHRYVAYRYRVMRNIAREATNIITLHLGNGCSATAISAGNSIDTSMGLTPLEGLVMGTRSGDLDPAVVFYLHREAGLSVDDIDDLLNKRSGMLGLAGANDMREVGRRAADGDQAAVEALDVYCYRIRKYVGAYTAALGRVDALVFTAGVGENNSGVRAGVCQGLEGLGVTLDPKRNRARSGRPRTISPDDAPVAVLVVPTNEELEIAEQTLAVVGG